MRLISIDNLGVGNAHAAPYIYEIYIFFPYYSLSLIPTNSSERKQPSQQIRQSSTTRQKPKGHIEFVPERNMVINISRDACYINYAMEMDKIKR